MLAKVCILLVVVVVVNAQYGYRGEPIYPPQPYSFSYGADNEDGGGLSQQEVGDEAGGKRGSYSYQSPDGLTRTVEYVADELGFRAVVHTNEPGTESQNPADVQVNSVNAPHQQYPSFPHGGYGGYGRGYY